MTTNDLAVLHNQISNKLQGLYHQPSILNWISTLQALRNSYPGLEISLGLPGGQFQTETLHTPPNPADHNLYYARHQIGIILHPGALRTPVDRELIKRLSEAGIPTESPTESPTRPDPPAPMENLPVWLL